MRVNRVIADVRVDDIEAAKDFYAGFLGLTSEEFDMGWVARYQHLETGAVIQLVTDDATAPESPVASILVDDVDEAWAEAQASGYEIVHPLTTEPWGVRRFFVRAPDDNIYNIVHHPPGHGT